MNRKFNFLENMDYPIHESSSNNELNRHDISDVINMQVSIILIKIFNTKK